MMERIIKPLTPTELEIMEILWRENRPLSALEILELSENRSWKQNSLYPTLQHLQEKNAVVITGYVPVRESMPGLICRLIPKANTNSADWRSLASTWISFLCSGNNWKKER